MYLEEFVTWRERRRATIIGLSLTVLVIGTPLIYIVLLRLLTLLIPESAQNRQVLLWLSVIVQYGIASPLAVLVMVRIPADPMERHRWDVGRLARCSVILIFLMIAGVLLGDLVNTALSSVLGHMPTDPVNTELANEDMLYMVITSVILAPVTEEYIMRKCLIDRINRWGDLTAMLLSGVCFGLLHGNFYQFFYAFLIGTFFAWIYLRTANILYTIGLHMLFNLLFGVVAGLLNSTGGWLGSILSGAFYALEFGGAVAGFCVCVRGWKRFRMLKGWMDVKSEELASTILLSPGMIVFYVAAVIQFALFLE